MGVGYSDLSNSYRAGVQAAKESIKTEINNSIDIAIIFISGRHNSEAVLRGIRSILGRNTRLTGGSTSGIITNEKLGYEDFYVGILTLDTRDYSCKAFLQNNISLAPEVSGIEIVNQINALGCKAQNLLIFYDSVKLTANEGGPALNMATPILNGIRKKIPKEYPFAGIGVIGDALFSTPANVWLDEEIKRDAAIILSFTGNIQLHTTILHGTKPASDYHTVTKVDGPELKEIDGIPAITFLENYFGQSSTLKPEHYPLFLTLGVNRGKRFDLFKEENYASRLCLSINKKNNSIIMFEPDLIVGDKIQIMIREFDTTYIKNGIENIFNKTEGKKPIFAIYLDCIGRSKTFSGLEFEEAAEVQKQVANRVPMLGVYSGVEVAQVGGQLQALDWTGVFCLFTEKVQK